MTTRSAASTGHFTTFHTSSIQGAHPSCRMTASEMVGVPSRMTMATAPPTMTSSVTRSIMLRNFQIRRPSSTS